MDYKSVFTNLYLELQQNMSWIKGLGKNPQKSELIHWRQCLLSGGHRSVFPRTPRNTGVYTRHPTFVTAASDVLTRLPAKLSKNGMRVYTLSDRRSKKQLRVLNAILFSTAVFSVAVSTRHSWLWQMWDDKYTCRCFSESEGTRFGSPGQKALPSMNEFTLLWIFAFIPYSRSIPLTFQAQICKDGFISIVFDVSPEWYLFGRCFRACNCTSCAEERRPQ